MSKNAGHLKHKSSQGSNVNLQTEVLFCALILAAAALLLLPSSAYTQTQPAAQSLDGLWLSDGYGDFLEFQGDSLKGHEITMLSCIASDTATRKTGPGPSNEIDFAEGDDTFRILPGTSADTRWLHEDGSISNVLLRRSGSRPEPCDHPLADTPLTNYQVFWETFSEQYPFFALREMDWLAVDKKFRPQVTPETKPEELFRILSEMIDPLHDAHTFIEAKSIQKRFHGFRPSAEPMHRKNAARINEIIEKKYVSGGLHDFCNKKLQFGLMQSSQDAQSSNAERHERADTIGYLRIHSFRLFQGPRIRKTGRRFGKCSRRYL